ncbi:hypothetical protein EV649_0998 [Kribbella sp. VKM Ac-2569]|uniref:hypothetical protein n=1 Tax=Kribbella sp. VKM Ac-2569 TaxID=2512220 RepID=UPI00102AAB9A|nr:hypothetical protein [Kribbella sp. VKM Ac-2569]RZT27242.1 hypothetical protein EV649_0998 [Kribbella sp. VKM Ac-2569]
MTDTETRLRDYLHTQAATVPDNAQGPGLEPPERRRNWPVLAAAAAIVVVVVLAASLLTRGDRPDPARRPAPPVSGAAPQVPYTVYEENALHDGKQKVRIPKGIDGFFFGRAGGGWLGQQMSVPGQFRPGILLPNSTFRTLGPDRSGYQVLSPDRKQVAMYHYLSNTRGQVIVVDIQSGKQVAKLPAAAGQPALLGWNQDGLWMDRGKAGLVVWQPASGQQRPVSIAGFDGSAAIPAAAGTIVVSTKADGKRCLKAGALRDDGFKVLRDYCDEGPEHLYPVLSPDGRTMIHSVRAEAIDINTGQVTKLKLQDRMTDTLPLPVFENGTQLLTLTETVAAGGAVHNQLFRCDVTSGECKLLVKNADGWTIHEP